MYSLWPDRDTSLAAIRGVGAVICISQAVPTPCLLGWAYQRHSVPRPAGSMTSLPRHWGEVSCCRPAVCVSPFSSLEHHSSPICLWSPQQWGLGRQPFSFSVSWVPDCCVS